MAERLDNADVSKNPQWLFSYAKKGIYVLYGVPVFIIDYKSCVNSV